MSLADLIIGNESGGDPNAAAPKQFGGQEAFSYLVKNGYSPVQAAAIAGNIQQESSFNPSAVNQKEGAEGLIQWRESRLDGLKKFAAETGRDYRDPTAQLDFIGREMSGPEAKSGAAFRAAADLPSANAALKNYIRYGDGSQGARLQYANSFLGGQPQQVAQNAPASPAATPAAPLQPAQSQPPIFPQQAGQGGGSFFGQMPVEQTGQPPPIFAPPKKPIDLSRLRAAFQASGNRGFFFGQG